jgi:hypothetical protein
MAVNRFPLFTVDKVKGIAGRFLPAYEISIPIENIGAKPTGFQGIGSIGVFNDDRGIAAAKSVTVSSPGLLE